MTIRLLNNSRPIAEAGFQIRVIGYRIRDYRVAGCQETKLSPHVVQSAHRSDGEIDDHPATTTCISLPERLLRVGLKEHTRLPRFSPLWLDSLALGRRSIPTESGTASFFCHSFSCAPLRANSCVLQLRVFCFPGSSPTPWVPPIKQPLASEAEATRLSVPQENGARKRRFKNVLP